MSKKSNAPFNNQEEIAARRRQLQKTIRRQERRLSQDIDAYQDEIESVKSVWHGLANFRRFRKNGLSSGISKVTGGSSRITTAFSLGIKAARWLLKRRKKNNKEKNKDTE